ncbi:unnamed protein product [Lampetra fluviatilis]
MLEPLILGKMLELSKDLAIPMLVCGHEPLTSRLAAKCLDAQFNLRRWAQMAAWMGDPAVDGNPTGWAPSRVVRAPDDVGTDDLVAVAGHWVPRRGTAVPVVPPKGSATLSQPDAGDPAPDGPPPAAMDVDPTALPTPPGLQSARAPILVKDGLASRTRSKSLPFR